MTVLRCSIAYAAVVRHSQRVTDPSGTLVHFQDEAVRSLIGVYRCIGCINRISPSTRRLFASERTQTILYYFASGRRAGYFYTYASLSVCLSAIVCLSASMYPELHVLSSPDFLFVTRGRGSVLLWQRCDEPRTSSFADDIINVQQPGTCILKVTQHVKGSPCSIAERRVPELIPVLGSQPIGDVSHKPGDRLQLLSARPVVTVAALKRAASKIRCSVNRGTMGVNSLPKTVTRQRRDCNLNPGPTAPESSTLTTRLPSHPDSTCGNTIRYTPRRIVKLTRQGATPNSGRSLISAIALLVMDGRTAVECRKQHNLFNSLTI